MGKLHLRPRVTADRVFPLAKETLVTAPGGFRQIGEMVGKASLLVPSAGPGTPGIWKQGTIRSYGIQKLLTVYLERDRKTRSFRGTPEHRWTIWDSYEEKFVEVDTATLLPGDLIPVCYPEGEKPGGSWKVIEVRGSKSEGEVFCATVPGGLFTLAGNVLTGNCPYSESHAGDRDDS